MDILGLVGDYALKACDFIGSVVVDGPTYVALAGTCFMPVNSYAEPASSGLVESQWVNFVDNLMTEKPKAVEPSSDSGYSFKVSPGLPKPVIKIKVEYKDVKRYSLVKSTISKVYNPETHKFEFEYLIFTARAESTFNAKAKSFTGAEGVWQFTERTAKQYGLKDRHCIKESAKATIKLARDNRRALRRLGINPDVLNLYRAHMVGAQGLAIVNKAASGKSLSPQEKLKFNKIVGVNMSKHLLNKYFYNWKTKPVKRKKYSYQHIAKHYLDLFSDREKQYLKDISWLEYKASRGNFI